MCFCRRRRRRRRCVMRCFFFFFFVVHFPFQLKERNAIPVENPPTFRAGPCTIQLRRNWIKRLHTGRKERKIKKNKIQMAKKGEQGRRICLCCGRRTAAAMATTRHARKSHTVSSTASPYLFNLDDAPLYNPSIFPSSGAALHCIALHVVSHQADYKIEGRKKKNKSLLVFWPFAAIRVSLSIGWQTPLPPFHTFFCFCLKGFSDVSTTQYKYSTARRSTCVWSPDKKLGNTILVYPPPHVIFFFFLLYSWIFYMHFRSLGDCDTNNSSNNNLKKKGFFFPWLTFIIGRRRRCRRSLKY